jgi:hypothetical protein
MIRDSPNVLFSFRDDITIKIDGEGTGFTLGARDYKGVQAVLIEVEDDGTGSEHDHR